MGSTNVKTVTFLPTTLTPLRNQRGDYNIFYGCPSGIHFNMTKDVYTELADAYKNTSAVSTTSDVGYKEFIDKNGGLIEANVNHIVLYEDPADETVNQNPTLNDHKNLTGGYTSSLSYATVYRNFTQSTTDNTVYNTFCLPFDVTKAQLADAMGDEDATGLDAQLAGITIYQYNGRKNRTLVFTPLVMSEKAASNVVITANHPVLVKLGVDYKKYVDSYLFNLSNATASAITSATTPCQYEGTLSADGIYPVCGTYQPITVNNSSASDEFYYISGSNMYAITKTGVDVPFKALRAYIKSPASGGNSKNGGLMLSIGDTVTSIDNVNIDGFNASADGSVYTLGGLRMADSSHLSKGIYIKNGNKFVVK
jgi:hypothetical protein